MFSHRFAVGSLLSPGDGGPSSPLDKEASPRLRTVALRFKNHSPVALFRAGKPMRLLRVALADSKPSTGARKSEQNPSHGRASTLIIGGCHSQWRTTNRRPTQRPSQRERQCFVKADFQKRFSKITSRQGGLPKGNANASSRQIFKKGFDGSQR